MDNFRSSTWFVTGATGLVGSTIIETLRRNELNVIGLVRKSSPTHMLRFLEKLDVKLVYGDLLDPDSYINYLPTCDVVVHTAAAVLIRDKQTNWDINYRGTKVLCEAVRESSIKRFIHISTAGVYGTGYKGEATEKHQPQPYGYYLKSKLAAEKVILEEFKDLSVTIIRPPFIFGEPTRDRHFFQSIAKFSRKVLPKVWRYNPKFGFVHAEDIARLVFLVGTAYSTPSDIYNIQSFDLDYNSLVKMVNEALGDDTIMVPVPYTILYIFATIGEIFLSITGNKISLRKRLAMFKNDWNYATKRVREELGFEPIHSDKYELERLFGKYMKYINQENDSIDIRNFVEN